MNEVLQYLKKNGQRLDTEIAAATKLPLSKIRGLLDDLSAQGQISRCKVIRFNQGKEVESVLCRVAGYIPPKSPGRKPAAG